MRPLSLSLSFALLLGALSAMARPPHASPRRDPKKLCLELTRTFAKNYRLLFRDYLSGMGGLAPKQVSSTPAAALARLLPSDCGKEANRMRALHVFLEGLASHSGKIGLLVDESGPEKETGEAILSGIQRALKESGRSALLVALDTRSSPAIAEAELAALIFQNQVGLVIASGSSREIQRLAPWADKLAVPILFISPDTSFLEKSIYAFRIFPEEAALGDALAAMTASRGYHRIGILRSEDAKSDLLIKSFVDSLKLRAIQVAHVIPYESGDFKSMSGAIQQMFNIDKHARAAEYRSLMRRERARSESEGVRFDPRRVILKPEIDIDALMIPDDFRIVRHFVKLLEYNEVKEMPLIGDFEWRSQGLIDPPEPFLENAFFADFIPGYDTLPKALRTIAGASTEQDYDPSLFIDPEKVDATDFELIGYRAASIALRALANPKIERLKLRTILENERLPQSGFFPASEAFSKGHLSAWPAFVFEVTKGAKSIARVEEPGGKASLTLKTPPLK